MKIILTVLILCSTLLSVNTSHLMDDTHKLWKNGCFEAKSKGCYKENNNYNPCKNSRRIECKKFYKGLNHNRPL